MRKRIAIRVFCVFCMALFTSCAGCREPAPVSSPPGYDLKAPKKFVVGDVLHEISGIVFLRGNPDTLYAIEDEDGKLFYFHLGDGKYPYWKFGKHGDYEDVAILDNKEFVVLRSDGSLFVFPVDRLRKGENPGKSKKSEEQLTRVYEHILPAGEYEGLYGDEGGKLIALCKNCPDDDQRDEVSAYVLQYNGKHELAITNHFLITVKASKLKSEHKKVRFHPSALARHPLTKEWYILSSVNKALLVLDEQWKLVKIYQLDPALFKQPEGLAFDRQGNMYISNEGHGGNANVLLFSYKP